MKVLLVTGGAGFVGSNFIRYFLRRNKSFVIVNYDNLTYSGNMNNLREIERSPRYHFVKGNICNQELVNYVIKRHRPEYIINFAGESSKEKSIINPAPFVETNITGTLTLLESARYFWSKHNFEGNRFIQVSTDEVYGYSNTKDNYFTEDSGMMPANPYSASKAGAELLVKSFNGTYGFPAIISRCCNNYGPYQHLEKFVPACIKNSLANERIFIKAEESNICSEWIHVLDHCNALIRILFYGKSGETYNISPGEEISGIELSKKIIKMLGNSDDSIEITGKAPKSEMRCAMNSYKIRNNLNCGHKYNLDDGLSETIRWYKENRKWWDND